MILEGLVTTLNVDGTLNVSPMGPRVDAEWTRLIMKPYQTSRTYANLKRTGQGVFHVTDNVEMLAHAAVGLLTPEPENYPAVAVEGRILSDACRWYAFRVATLDDSQERTEIVCDVIDRGRQRDFFGLSRAKHAVVEAAILATRVRFLPPGEILSQFERLQPLVDKTGGPAEARAFAFLHQYVRDHASNI